MFACGPILELSYLGTRTYTREFAEGCIRHNAEVARYVEATPSLKYAVLSFNLENYTENQLYFRERATESETNFLVDQIAGTLDWLVAHGVSPVLVGPAPHNGADIGRCLAESRLFRTPIEDCDFERPHHAKEEAVLQELAARGYAVLRIEEALCDGQRCSASIDANVMYRDQGHLTWQGSRLVSDRLNIFARADERL